MINLKYSVWDEGIYNILKENENFQYIRQKIRHRPIIKFRAVIPFEIRKALLK